MIRILTFPVFRRHKVWSFFVLPEDRPGTASEVLAELSERDGKEKEEEKACDVRAREETATEGMLKEKRREKSGKDGKKKGEEEEESVEREAQSVVDGYLKKEGKKGSFLGQLEPWLFSTYLKGTDKIKAEWDELEQAPQGTVKHRIATVAGKLMEQIPPSETFLKHAASHAAAKKKAEGKAEGGMEEAGTEAVALAKCQLVHPSNISQKEVEEELQYMLKTNVGYHHRWMLLNVVFLPLTSCMAILPGPNVFVLWNGFRLYSHYQARKGATYLLDLIKEHHADDVIEFKACDALANVGDDDWKEFAPLMDDDCSDDECEPGDHEDIKGEVWEQEKRPICDTAVDRICRMYDSPSLKQHVHRLRDLATHQHPPESD